MKKCLSYLFAIFTILSAHTNNLAYNHAPIGVMGDHMHSKGEIMFSYRFMNMLMKGNLNGEKRIGVTELSNLNYSSAGSTMLMKMHMLGMMYAPTNKITLMVMSNYIINDMEMEMLDMESHSGHNHSSNNMMQHSSSGFGDASIVSLMQFYNNHNIKSHVTCGFSIPFGSINKKSNHEMHHMSEDGDHMHEKSNLPYGMQLGSGSIDPIFGAILNYYNGNIVYGTQVLGKHRITKNENKYKLGNENHISAWLGYNFSKNISLSTRYLYRNIGEINGQDEEIDSTMSPLGDVNNYGRIDSQIGFGVNYLHDSGHRLAIEYLLVPIQNVNGIQMKLINNLIIGWQYSI